jgi:hypothetical protein
LIRYPRKVDPGVIFFVSDFLLRSEITFNGMSAATELGSFHVVMWFAVELGRRVDKTEVVANEERLECPSSVAGIYSSSLFNRECVDASSTWLG